MRGRFLLFVFCFNVLFSVYVWADDVQIQDDIDPVVFEESSLPPVDLVEYLGLWETGNGNRIDPADLAEMMKNTKG